MQIYISYTIITVLFILKITVNGFGVNFQRRGFDSQKIHIFLHKAQNVDFDGGIITATTSATSTTSYENITTQQQSVEEKQSGAISMNVDELAVKMGGRGRARLVWDMYRIGVDPLVYFRHNNNIDRSKKSLNSDNTENSLSNFMNYVENCNDEDESIRNLLPTSRKTQGLGSNALNILEQMYESYGGGLEGATATLSFVSTSSDGTTKLLIKLSDGLEVETVIIPWHDKGWSTVCISSQVGCKQGCKFCATGKMGKLRSLTSDEILAQFFFALKICRLSSPNIPTLGNVVCKWKYNHFYNFTRKHLFLCYSLPSANIL